MASKRPLSVALLIGAITCPAGAQVQGPDALTTSMQFAGALVGAEVMLIEYSKSPCGPLHGRRFGVNEAVKVASPHLAPSQRKTLQTYVQGNATQLHDEYRRLTAENLRTMQAQGMTMPTACTTLLNVYDKAYRTALEALQATR